MSNSLAYSLTATKWLSWDLNPDGLPQNPGSENPLQDWLGSLNLIQKTEPLI